VFSGKHCDLSAISEQPQSGGDTFQLQSCCSNLSSAPSLHSSNSPGSVSPARSTRSTPHSDLSLSSHPSSAGAFPFARHHSSRVCLTCALNIADAFDRLPYPNPNPNGLPSDTPYYLGPTSPLITPRTMPAFACCAMQCSYSLLMIKSRTDSLYSPTEEETAPLIEDEVGRLHQGLWSIWGTLENFATAFEALGGMRGALGHPLFKEQTNHLGRSS
jgi:hypothetical protein